MKSIFAHFSFLFILCMATNSFAAVPGVHLPFTADEDKDGARFIWFVMNSIDDPTFKHAYRSAKNIPKGNRWLPIPKGSKPQTSDMLWWQNAVALLGTDQTTATFRNEKVEVKSLVGKFGKPKYRRYNTPEKNLTIMYFAQKGEDKEQAITPVVYDTEEYTFVFDTAINTMGEKCKLNSKQIIVLISDADENTTYEIDKAGCISGENKKVSKEFFRYLEGKKSAETGR